MPLVTDGHPHKKERSLTATNEVLVLSSADESVASDKQRVVFGSVQLQRQVHVDWVCQVVERHFSLDLDQTPPLLKLKVLFALEALGWVAILVTPLNGRVAKSLPQDPSRTAPHTRSTTELKAPEAYLARGEGESGQ